MCLHQRFSSVLRLAFCCSIALFSTDVCFGQNTSNAQYRVSQPAFESLVSERSRNLVRDTDGAVSGIVGSVNPEGMIVISGSGVDVRGLEFLSGERLLVPVPSIDNEAPSAAPFQALISNTPARVTYGNLGFDVRIDGSVTLGVGYSGRNPGQDLSAVWGRGTEALPFPISVSGTPEYSPFNLQEDGSALVYTEAVFGATIEAGSATGTPPDFPSARVDPNDGTARFPGVGSFEVVHPTLGTFICSGSVLTDTHILTAGHCFDQDNDGLPDPGITTSSVFNLNDGSDLSATRSVSTVDIHPDFGGFVGSGANDDIAIVTLGSSVPVGTTKYSLRASGMTSGEIIEMVGYGVSGHGDVGGIEVLPDFSVKRSGINAAELFVLDDEGSGEEELFFYDFDGPTGTGFLGGPTLGNDLETVVRGGDSGGPAFVDVAGENVIAGINTFEFVLPPTTPPTGEFGVLGGGVILDAPQVAWIAGVASDVRVLPEPSGVTLTLPLVALFGLLRRRRSN